MNQNLLEAGTYLLNQHYDITNNKIIFDDTFTGKSLEKAQ